jgi:protein PhnA
MTKELIERSAGCCEVCGTNTELSALTPSPKGDVADAAAVCATCKGQFLENDVLDSNHWRCLNDSMWSEVPAVKVIAYRMLNRLKGEGWPMDLLDMLYLDDETLEWAKAEVSAETALVHKDSNGAILQAGDTVTIIKDLNVKGTSLVAKRGTAVRNITLVHDNAEQIEGRVEGQKIVILTQYVKK